MTAKTRKHSLKRTARIAGVLYLVLLVSASVGYVGYRLIIPGDAAATAANIVGSEGQFRISLVSDSAVFLTEIVLVAVLYVLLEPADKTLALIAAFARLAMTTIQGVNLLNHVAALRLLSGADYLRAFEPDQLRALALLFLDLHDYGILVWGLFFGLHLLFLGYLVYKSGHLPRILGVLLVFASLCYLAQTIGIILLPKYKEVLNRIGYLSFVEIAFPLWLLIKGVRDQRQVTTEAN